MTDRAFSSNAESMSRAQVAEPWGVHDVRLEIPKEKVLGSIKVPRPFGSHPSITMGWEDSTNSYPRYGQGHVRQFYGQVAEFSDGWVKELQDDFPYSKSKKGAE